MLMNKFLLEQEFESVRNMGWVKSLRNGTTGVGYTFEKLLGLQENSLAFPDFYNIEIKTHRKFSKSFICLFSCDPKGNNSYEIKHIYDNYGYFSNKDKNKKVLNTSLFCNRKKRVGDYFFYLKIDRYVNKLCLHIYNKNGDLLEKSSFWSFNILQEKLYNKLEYLAYITAENKFVDGIEFFKYTHIYFYKLKSFNTFLDLLEQQKICISFKVGGNINLNFPWQIDNHGTSFSIRSNDLKLLYSSF